MEETLNALLEAEADQLCNAKRYERSEARRDTRAGHYERKLQTKAGEVRLKTPSRNRDTAPQLRPWSARRDGIGYSAPQEGRRYPLLRRAIGSAPFWSLATGRVLVRAPH